MQYVLPIDRQFYSIGSNSLHWIVSHASRPAISIINKVLALSRFTSKLHQIKIVIVEALLLSFKPKGYRFFVSRSKAGSYEDRPAGVICSNHLQVSY